MGLLAGSVIQRRGQDFGVLGDSMKLLQACVIMPLLVCTR